MIQSRMQWNPKPSTRRSLRMVKFQSFLNHLGSIIEAGISWDCGSRPLGRMENAWLGQLIGVWQVPNELHKLPAAEVVQKQLRQPELAMETELNDFPF